MENKIKIVLPDVGGEEVDVIDICVSVGDILEEEDAIITVETEKASMDIPTTSAGKVIELKVKVGDKITQDTLICIIETNDSNSSKEYEVEEKSTEIIIDEPLKEEVKIVEVQKEVVINTSDNKNISDGIIYASPSIRKLAREFGVDLSQVNGSGRNNRIILEDVKSFIKNRLSTASTTSTNNLGFDLPATKEVDFSKFGEIEVKELSKIQKISGANLHKNYLSIPHITQFDEVDITLLEEFRKSLNEKALKLNRGIKISPLIFVLKATAKALELHPTFNSSLSNDNTSIILKKYIHIGVAVDTPNGLVVPVIKNVNTKSINELALELSVISKKARDGKLTIQEMQGGCFTISSLGGIGGTSFTPIINSPEVAILGLSKSQIKPVYNGKEFVPKLMLPLSVSYDHRVIDGAEGARFTNTLVNLIGDIRNIII